MDLLRPSERIADRGNEAAFCIEIAIKSLIRKHIIQHLSYSLFPSSSSSVTPFSHRIVNETVRLIFREMLKCFQWNLIPLSCLLTTSNGSGSLDEISENSQKSETLHSNRAHSDTHYDDKGLIRGATTPFPINRKSNKEKRVKKKLYEKWAKKRTKFEEGRWKSKQKTNEFSRMEQTWIFDLSIK